MHPKAVLPDRPARPDYASRPLYCGTAWYTDLLAVTSSLLDEISNQRFHTSCPASDTTRHVDERRTCRPSTTFHAILKGNQEEYIFARTHFFSPALTGSLKDMFEDHDMFPSIDRIVGSSEACFEIVFLQRDEYTVKLLDWSRTTRRPLRVGTVL